MPSASSTGTSRRRVRFAALVLLPLFLSFSSRAVEQITLRLGTLSGVGWRADDVRVSLSVAASRNTTAQIQIASLHLPDPVGRLDGVRVACDDFRWESGRFVCAAGYARVDHPLLDHPEFSFSVAHGTSQGRTQLRLDDVKIAAGSLAITARLRGEQWELDLAGNRVDLEQLPRLFGLQLDPVTSLAGTANLKAQISGRAGLPDGWRLTGLLSGGALETATGEYAAENVVAQIELGARQSGRAWQFDSGIELKSGVVLVSPVVLEPQGAPIELTATGSWHLDTGALQLSAMEYDHPDVLQLQASIRLRVGDETALEAAQVVAGTQNAAEVYRHYLESLVFGTALDALDVQGKIRARLDYKPDKVMEVSLALEQVSIDDRVQRFGLEGLSGELAWSRAWDVPGAWLQWQGGHVYRMKLGAGRLEAQTRPDGFRLTSPAVVPVLDGALHVDKLDVSGLGNSGGAIQFDGLLTPIDLQIVSAALDWPPLAGKLSGVIPGLSYRDGSLGIDGALLMRVFDGAIVMRNLSLVDVFGVLPELNTDIEIRQLDLETLTRTFSFGRIDGRLEGEVSGLRLENWRPVAFDAWFATPDDDPSRHRISQAAVDHITSLGGGGIGGALSRTFLRMFENFSYDRLGLSCKLRRGVCEMNGVAPAERGYYIVKGGGLPRIDVIGYNHQVDWEVLLQRLTRITGGAM